MTLQQKFIENIELLENLYKQYEKNVTHTAVEFAERLNIDYTDSIRRGLSYFINNTLYPNTTNKTETPKILIYDIETSLCEFTAFWTGKQFVGHKQLRNEPRIITVAWKWYGENKVYDLEWDENQDDRTLMEKFLKVYNDADVVIGFNNKNFDDRFVNARALKHNLFVNTHLRSFDIMKQAKRLFRLPSYAMNYIAAYTGVATKYNHSGIEMWEKIQYGEAEEARKALDEMIHYNRQDITVTEEVYVRLRKYMGVATHLGVLQGEEKWTCPNCGSKNVELFKKTVTPAGTVQVVMKCKEDDSLFKITNKVYMNFLEETVNEPHE